MAQRITRKIKNEGVYKVSTERANYVVLLEHAKNDINGNPRFNATIIMLNLEEMENYNFLFHRNYTFAGHYWADSSEAKFITEYMEKEMIKDGVIK